MRIMDSQDHILREKIVRLIKLLWQHREVEEVTWELEGTIHANYPFLFEDRGTFFFLVIDIEMTVAYACDIECVYVCEFRAQNSFKGGECKTREKNSIFLKNGKTEI